MGARDKIREYFIANGGKVLRIQQIRKVAGISEYARRIRELRDEEGFQIKSHVDRADLKPGEYIPETLDQKPVISRTISPQLRRSNVQMPSETTLNIIAKIRKLTKSNQKEIYEIPKRKFEAEN